MVNGMESGKIYGHERSNVFFHCVAVEEGKATGYWLTKHGTMLSTLSDRIPVKDFKGWSEVKLKEIAG